MVDGEDYPKLIIYEWFERKGKYSSYALAKVTPEMKEKFRFLRFRRWRSKQPIGMPYLIIGTKPGHIIDHKDHNGLNNQKLNIRHATNRQNSANQRKLQREFPFKGVYPSPTKGKYRAFCDHVYLGLFSDPVLAARAYDVEAMKKFGEFALLNFEKGGEK